MFPINHDALRRIIAPGSLRWIAFGHFEADERGSMNEWLAAAPQATPTHGRTGCMVSLNDFADRAPRELKDGEIIDLGVQACPLHRHASHPAWVVDAGRAL